MPKSIISIIIPTYNEEKHIEKCLLDVLAFSIPENYEIEILVIDGDSRDKTIGIVKELIKIDSRIKLLDNPNRFQSFAMNIGINNAKGDWILRLDAHTFYPNNYLNNLFEIAVKTGADNCGGLITTYPGDESYSAALVQALTTHAFGVGDSGFRTGIREGDVDTVPFGFFKREIFGKIGLFDERLVRAQDYEFNKRIIKYGGKIWLNPQIRAEYFNQKSIVAFYKKQIKLEAPYNAYMWYLAPYTFTYRHAITGVFATGIIGGILLSPFFSFIKYAFFSVMALYFILAFISAIQQARRYKKLLHIVTLPISFFLYHFLHGIGVLVGLLRLATGTAQVQKIKEPWGGYGAYRIFSNNK